MASSSAAATVFRSRRVPRVTRRCLRGVHARILQWRQGPRTSRSRSGSSRRPSAAGAAALETSRHFEALYRLRQARATNPAARLLAFVYNRSAKNNVTGGVEECPVCLGAFQLGETVRMLPLCGRDREHRDPTQAAAAAPLPRALPRLETSRHFEALHRLRQARATNPAARLPAFMYNRSAKNIVTGGGECPVCLGAFQLGETVRLLPLCLHLYHVECIDPWLDAHSTCPICRSDASPTMDVPRLPPV